MIKIMLKTMYRHIIILLAMPKGQRAMVASTIGKLILLLVAILLGLMIVYLVVPSLMTGAENASSMVFERDGLSPGINYED